MRRMIITAIVLTGLAVPGAAIASHQGEHQGRAEDHGVHQHKRHHRHAHLVRFGNTASTQAASPTGATPPPAPAGRDDETAGTIASFTSGTLTIKVNDGSTVSGTVTEGTEIECRSAMAAAARDGNDDQGDDRGHDGQSNSGPGDGRHGDVSGRDGDDNDANDDNDNNDNDQAEHCTTAALVPGAVVREAELRVSSAGSVWEKVELND
jgi:hypothetical protein